MTEELDKHRYKFLGDVVLEVETLQSKIIEIWIFDENSGVSVPVDPGGKAFEQMSRYYFKVLDEAGAWNELYKEAEGKNDSYKRGLWSI